MLKWIVLPLLFLLCIGFASAKANDGICDCSDYSLSPGSATPVKGDVTVTWDFIGSDCDIADPHTLTVWTTYNMATTWIELGEATSATSTSFTFDSAAGLTPDAAISCGYWFFLSPDSSAPTPYSEMGGIKNIDNLPSRIQVLSPNGGEEWGGIQTIKWSVKNCKAGEMVDITGTTGGEKAATPTTVFVIKKGIDACLGTYVWDTASQPYFKERRDWAIKMRLTPQDGDPCLAENDFSDDFFTVDNTKPVLTEAMLKSSTKVELTFSDMVKFQIDESTARRKITIKGLNPTGITIEGKTVTLIFGSSLGTGTILDDAQDLEISEGTFADMAGNPLLKISNFDVDAEPFRIDILELSSPTGVRRGEKFSVTGLAKISGMSCEGCVITTTLSEEYGATKAAIMPAFSTIGEMFKESDQPACGQKDTSGIKFNADTGAIVCFSLWLPANVAEPATYRIPIRAYSACEADGGVLLDEKWESVEIAESASSITRFIETFSGYVTESSRSQEPDELPVESCQEPAVVPMGSATGNAVGIAIGYTESNAVWLVLGTVVLLGAGFVWWKKK